MKITFIRHGQLEPPFDNYDKLSFKQITDLATLKIDPELNIQNDFSKVVQNIGKKNKVSLILHSGSTRSKETAKNIKSRLPYNVETEELDVLREILFDPGILVTEDDYLKQGMKIIRSNLFDALVFHKKGSERIEKVFEHIVGIDKFLKAQDLNILCITHGFFMRFLQLYFLKGLRNPGSITVKDLLEQKNFTYLDGFSINNLMI